MMRVKPSNTVSYYHTRGSYTDGRQARNDSGSSIVAGLYGRQRDIEHPQGHSLTGRCR